MGDEFLVNTYVTGDQFAPEIGIGEDGEFVVVWTSGTCRADGPDGSCGGIFARQFDRDGVARGDEFQVNETTAQNQSGASVARFANGESLVTWAQRFDGVFGRRLDGQGRLVGSEFALCPATPRTATAVSTVADDAFVIVWGEFSRVVAFRSSGDAASRSFVSMRASNPVAEVAATPVGRGGFVVAWSEYDGTRYGTDGTVRAVRFDSDMSQRGTFVSGLFGYGRYGYVENGLEGLGVAGDRRGRFVVAYSSYASGYLDHGYYPYQFDPGYSLGARVDRFGEAERESDIQVNASTSYGRGPGAVDAAMAGAGNYVVVWDSDLTASPAGALRPSDTDGRGVYARSFDCDGDAIEGVELQINRRTQGEQRDPAIALAPNGDGVVVWTTETPSGDLDIVGQRLRLVDLCALCGDADGDGSIRLVDALLTLRAAVQVAACDLARCDVDADGRLSVLDALRILHEVVGIGRGLPCAGSATSTTQAPSQNTVTTTTTTLTSRSTTTTTLVIDICPDALPVGRTGASEISLASMSR